MLILYRVMEIDGDGDPRDFGVVSTANLDQAKLLLGTRLASLGICGDVIVRLYPLEDGRDAVLESETFEDVTIQVPREDECTCEGCGETMYEEYDGPYADGLCARCWNADENGECRTCSRDLEDCKC
jgi:hypothetical protein